MDVFPEGRCRLILIGKTGAGKSATGNTILGSEVFKSQIGILSQTKHCGAAIAVRDGLEILVMDTPGLCDTEGEDEVIARRITQSLFAVAPGPHAVILVLKCHDRFTDQEITVFKMLKEIFGPKMTSHMIAIFTGKDQLDRHEGVDFEQQLQQAPKVQGLLAEADNRYLLFNNNANLPEREQQVDRLLQLVRQVVQQNGGCYFRHRMAREVDSAMTQMVKAELRDRTGGQLPEYIQDNTTTEVVKAEMKDNAGGQLPECLQDKLNIGTSSTTLEAEEEEEDEEEEEATPAELEAIMRRKELQNMKLHGAVRQKRDVFIKASSSEEDTYSDWKRRSRNSSEIKQPPAQLKENLPSPDPCEGPPKPARVAPPPPSQPQRSVSIEGQQQRTAGEDTVWEWDTQSSQVERMLDDLQEDLVKELALDRQSPFVYNVPDRPGMTKGEKMRLLEDALRKKIVSNPEQLSSEQRDHMVNAYKSVGQKIKEGMAKFAIKAIDQCILM